MSVMELLASRRTYRRFEQKAVPQDVVEDIIEALRLSSCGANRQAVRLVVVNRPEDVARVQPLVKWAAYLPPEQGTPKADELPTLYVAVMQDTSIPGDLATDTGIALANMTLAAWAKGVGSCIMGAINKPALTRLLGIEEPQKLAFMVAFGYPAHCLDRSISKKEREDCFLITIAELQWTAAAHQKYFFMHHSLQSSLKNHQVLNC